jgi:hypothetical protein
MTRKMPNKPTSIVDDALLLGAINKALTDHGARIAGTVSVGDVILLLAERQQRMGSTPNTTGPAAINAGQDGPIARSQKAGTTAPPS